MATAVRNLINRLDHLANFRLYRRVAGVLGMLVEVAGLDRVLNALGEPTDGKGPLPTGDIACPFGRSPQPARARRRIGAYRKGSDSATDEAIRIQPKLENFLSQDKDLRPDFTRGYAALAEIFAIPWPADPTAAASSEGT